MPNDSLRFVSKLLTGGLPFIFRLLGQRVQALIHRLTYTPYSSDGVEAQRPKNIVILGASFAGLDLARRLAETLPSGFRVILIERNRTFHFQWVLPRFGVAPGLQKWAPFIPYDGIARGSTMVDGAMNLVYGEARRVRLGEVTVALRNEEGQDIQEVTIPWNMLVFATGCTQSAPGNVQGIADLGAFQARIAAQTTQRIAVIGGGAVGVELSADIRTFFPDKELVRVYQSRERLLPAFGLRLGEHAEKVLGDLGVEVVCGQRPEILGEKTLRTKDGEEEFDLIIPCTGQKPNSTLLKDIAPDAISNESGHILVQPTLQILTASESDALSRVFALGDVAQSGGPKMARAAQFQTEIVIKNICALAKESQARHVYTPNHFFEGSIKLTLGRGRIVVYGEENVDGKGSVLLEAKQRDDESGVKMAWWRLSAKYQPPK